MKTIFAEETTVDTTIFRVNLQNRLTDLIQRMRTDIDLVDDPNFQDLLRNGSEVLAGMKSVFANYGRENENSWLQ